MSTFILKKFIKSIICEANGVVFDPVRPEDLMDTDDEGRPIETSLAIGDEPKPEPEPELEVSSKALSTQHVQVKSLPPALSNALKAIGYNRPDVVVESAVGYYLSGSADNGTRNIVVAVNLVTGERKQEIGSWGGANPFEKKQVDLDGKVRPIPMNFAIIKGTNQGSKTLFARIIVNPGNLQALLPETTQEEVSPQEKLALNIIGGITSSYRKQYFEEKRLGPYSPTNPLLIDMQAKGWIKISKVGIQMTTLGKNKREEHKIHNL